MLKMGPSEQLPHTELKLKNHLFMMEIDFNILCKLTMDLKNG